MTKMNEMGDVIKIICDERWLRCKMSKWGRMKMKMKMKMIKMWKCNEKMD